MTKNNEHPLRKNPQDDPGCGYCDAHELNQLLFAALYAVSQVLSRSLDYQQTIQDVLRVLSDEAGLTRGVVSVVEPESGNLVTQVLQGLSPGEYDPVQYEPGEGILGMILERPRTVALAHASDDPRFLNRLGIYDSQLPFIAVPIKVGGAVQGVLSAQPEAPDDGLLQERAQFLEMVANLIGQNVRLSLEIQQEKASLAEERDLLRRTVRHQYGFDNVVGRSNVMRRVFDQVRLVSKWSTTVLLRGETGTGKELISNAIHYNSPRARGPLVKVNCAALPENLLESELFGHERGAFTGAVGARKGRFEQADAGTLFLDEIGEISPAFQAKLLRVLQEGEFERVGGNRTQKVDVRIIAATHRDLESAVELGDFREDLFYRLNVMPIYLPSLRERIEDIPDIARHLVGKIGNIQKRKLTLDPTALRRLANHDWPGNVRELENCLERAAVLSEDGIIGSDLIRFATSRNPPPPLQRPQAPGAANAPREASPETEDDADMSERDRVVAALEQAGWVQAKAARILGMTPRQIAYRIQTLNIEVKQF